MTGRILLYGATGYTGRLIAAAAAKRGIDLVCAGRDEAGVAAVAAPLGLPHVAAPLNDPAALSRILDGIAIVLHVAGPFSATSRPMVDACIAKGVHYLDITGEIDVFETCAGLGEKAAAAGVMLMPGVGFDVVPSDCLAAHMKRRMPDATRLRLAMSGLSNMSRGTAKTSIEAIAKGTMVRRGGRLTEVAGTPRTKIDFGKGPVDAIGISWGDVATAFHTTAIPDIEVFFESTPELSRMLGLPGGVRRLLGTAPAQFLLKQMVNLMPAGPDAKHRQTARAILLGEATNAAGETLRSRLDVIEPYALTAETALLIAGKVVAGAFQPGYQTPGGAYGPDLILEVPDCRREDLNA
ncbi:saccharopine dehydrogenase NADP-binding domain-containing protein [Zavarzinia compransoris]|uniref:saccharopine dehydrogenase family protein n=1 Tax=Zavarzinia marina TaxID=2911065 RepID=UPI001F2C77D3|nr:saccharopine dehydrogenase NADP-binding domain-containing protein [Zavarzinia marina]MCF4164272.1 saccharopine dehydrogenase NADP-binding domain-containing protein [Zavarzinia marina]